MKKFTLIVFFLFVLSGCGQAENEASSDLYIAAASDLVVAFSEIEPLFEEKFNVSLTISYGSTGQLTEQINNGAPFDVFAAANADFIDDLEKNNRILADTREVYALGKINLASTDSRFSLHSIEDLRSDDIKKIAIANPDHAPYGKAAKQALQTSLLWDEVQPKLIYGRNIADTLTQLETGNADVAIIASSLTNENLTSIPIDVDLYEPLHQTIAVIDSTKNEELSRLFVDFILTDAKPVLESYGFDFPKE